jgi:PAS domain S-box-containing protein
MSAEETKVVLHELRVHQIELEMQNEELQRSQVELDATRARYFDLYDLAPIGYCTISEQGLFLEVNLTTATLLGINRGTLIGRRLSQSILKEDQDIYYLHRKLLVETGRLQTCELRMVKKDRTIFWAHLITTVDQDAEGKPLCRVILSDITARKFRDVEGELATLLTSQTKSSDKLRQCLANLTASLQNWSGCSAVGIRLHSGDYYPLRCLRRDYAPHEWLGDSGGPAQAFAWYPGDPMQRLRRNPGVHRRSSRTSAGLPAQAISEGGNAGGVGEGDGRLSWLRINGRKSVPR